MKNIIYGIIFIIVLMLQVAIAETSFNINTKKSTREQMEKAVNYIKSITPEKYLIEIDKIRKNVVGKYIEHKKLVCDGDFSSVILDDKGIKKGKKSVSLTNQEKLMCFRELKSLQVEYINNIYVARKKYLQFIHSKSIKELELSKNESIKNIEKSFSF